MLLASWMACAAPVDVLDRAPHVETLRTTPALAAAAGAASVVVVDDDGWQVFDAHGRSAPFEALAELPVAWARLGETALVLAGDVHVVHHEGPVPLGIDALWPAPARAMCADGAALWLDTGAGPHVWQRGALLGLQIDSHSPSGPLACGGTLHGERVAWVADGAAVHAVATNGASWAGFETVDFPHEVVAVAVSGENRVWAVSGTELFLRREEGWARVPVGTSVSTVLGAPLGSGVWLVTSDGLHWTDGTTLVRATEGPGITTEGLGRWHVDGLGRLVVRDDRGVHRLSMDRPLWLEAPLDGAILVEPVDIALVPTAPEELVELTLTLGDTPIELTDGVAALDPADWPAGEYVIEARAVYESQVASESRVLHVQSPGSVTWEEHIAAIHQASCALCHEGEADTLLRNAAEWRVNFDDIVTNVESGAMPLGGPPLSTAERSLIRAWRDGGFP